MNGELLGKIMVKQILLSRRAIISLVSVIIIMMCFAGMYFVPKVYGFRGEFFYPIVYFYGTPLAYVVPLGAFAVLAWQFFPTTTNAVKTTCITLLMFPAFFTLVGVFCYYFAFVSYFPLPAHFNHIYFEDKVYYLAWDNSTAPDFDSEHNRYYIYRCDRFGVMCREVRTIGGYRAEAISGYNFNKAEDVYFFVGEDGLYVQIGTETVSVPTG